LGIVIAIGSEGGFDDEEVGLFAGEGWSFLGLGPRVLRVESAVASAACAANWLFEPPVLYLPDT
jgi:RsmE family RNA methyltransferase